MLLREKNLVLEARSRRVVEQVGVVKEVEVAGNIHPIRTRHAVAAPGTGDHSSGSIQFADPRDQLVLCLAKSSHTSKPRRTCRFSLHLLHRAHAAQNHGDFGLIPKPLQRPLRRRAVHGKALHRLANIFRRIRQSAAQQRFHDHDGQPLACRQFQPTRPRLIFRIHVVVLNLAEVPQFAAVDDLLKARIVVVKGETEMPDASIGQRLGGLVQKIVLQNNVVPAILTQRVQKVKINVVRLQLLQLLAEKLIEVRRVLHHPHRKLGRQPTFSR